MEKINIIFDEQAENWMSHYRLLEPDDLNLYNDYGLYTKLDILNNDLARIAKKYDEGFYTWTEYLLACRNYGGWRREIAGITKIFSKAMIREMIQGFRMTWKIGFNPDEYIIHDWTI